MSETRKIKATFEGGYKVSYELEGKKVLTTDVATPENPSSYPSPVDTLCMALTACTSAHISMTLAKFGIELKEMNVETNAVVVEDPDKRITDINMMFNFKQEFPERERAALERSIKQCLIGHSLNPDIKKNVVYNYGVK